MIPLATIGRGGWTAYVSRTARVSGYDREIPAEYACAEIVVDTRVCHADEIAVLAHLGPVIEVDVPAGMVSRIFTGLVPWDKWGATGRPKECLRLGNAGPFDAVGPELYAELAASFGARVTRRGEAP